MITVPKMSITDAKIVLEAAERKASEIAVPMDIAVVDDGGNLLGFHRMDGAKITGIEIAINKAFTAAGTRRGTHEYAPIGEVRRVRRSAFMPAIKAASRSLAADCPFMSKARSSAAWDAVRGVPNRTKRSRRPA